MIEHKIHNYTYKFEFRTVEEITKYYDEDADVTQKCIIGLTDYCKTTIYIGSDITREKQLTTMKHELTHAFIDAYNINIADEECVCDFVGEYAQEICVLAEKILAQMEGENIEID